MAVQLDLPSSLDGLSASLGDGDDLILNDSFGDLLGEDCDALDDPSSDDAPVLLSGSSRKRSSPATSQSDNTAAPATSSDPDAYSEDPGSHGHAGEDESKRLVSAAAVCLSLCLQHTCRWAVLKLAHPLVVQIL